MSSQTHQIQLPEDLERRLRERAAAAGTDADTFIVRTLEEKLQAPRSFKEIFAPLHGAFQEQGAAADSIDQVFQDLRESSRRTSRE